MTTTHSDDYEILKDELSRKQLMLCEKGEKGWAYKYRNLDGTYDTVWVTHVPLSDREAESLLW